MHLEVLMSCMEQKDESIVRRSKITSDALVINQCSHNSVCEYFLENHNIRIINTTERGLSKSRNMAIAHAKGDICLLCDDDETFVENFDKKILRAFDMLPNADIIIFRVFNLPSRLKPYIYKLSYLQCLKVSSCQIAFRRTAIQKHNIKFDIFMGAGTGNGGGEENKFLLDCNRRGLNIYHVPIEIAFVAQEQSTWFKGYDKHFFYQRGIATRYMLGAPLAVAYAFFYVIKKHTMYKADISATAALIATLLGIKNNDIKMQQKNGSV